MNILKRAAAIGLIALAGAATLCAQPTEDSGRKVKTRVQPTYPAIARKMNVAGSVKVEVVVAPSGEIKSTKVIGGHPLLVNAAVDALKQWKYEAAGEETTTIVEFRFNPTNQ
ncbi:MAG TPA: energy transducer TonB [Terriglobales bacterium]|nr:energy transducer TonB [Terriglobales bacterium]